MTYEKDDLVHRTPTKSKAQQQPSQQQRRRRKLGQTSPLLRHSKRKTTKSLANLFSTSMLIAYALCITGILFLLDRYNKSDGNNEGNRRHLQHNSEKIQPPSQTTIQKILEDHDIEDEDTSFDMENHQQQHDAPLTTKHNNQKQRPHIRKKIRDNNKGNNEKGVLGDNYIHNNKKDEHNNNNEGDNSDGYASNHPKIPDSKWPVPSLDDETFEEITHPVLKDKKLSVPKFWSPPIHSPHDTELMTRSKAMQIGTCQVPTTFSSAAHNNNNNPYVRGADCPVHQRTIFVMIASYRDYQCRETVEQIYDRAAFPDRIRVAVVDQLHEDDNGNVDENGNDEHTQIFPCNQPIQPCSQNPEQALCKYQHLIDVVTMDASLSTGPVPARHVGYRMYRGEYYALQSDAHVSFVNNWEMSTILSFESTGNEMAVLSTYLSDFTDAMDHHGNSIKRERPIMCNNRFQATNGAYHIHHSVQPESKPAVHGTPQLHPWFSAGFSFSRGHFVVNVPYDWYQPMIFSGEEMSMAIRGFTYGYDYYAPESGVCFHHYAETPQGKAKRKNVHTFWENYDNYKDNPGHRAMRRLLGLLHMNPGGTDMQDPDDYDHSDSDLYGIGSVRSTSQLYSLLGIDVESRHVEGHQCRFVDSGKMHKLLVPLLRPDGMGIDYDQVEYEWIDPDPEATRREETTAPAEEEESESEDEESEEEEEKQQVIEDEDVSEDENDAPIVDDDSEEGGGL